MSQFIILFLRYVIAIAVACITSFGLLFLGIFIVPFAGFIGFLVVIVAVGFCGVFSGSRFLPESSRRLGSVVLLVFGLASYIWMIVHVNMVRSEDNSFSFNWLLPLAVGGLAAAYIFWKKPPNPSL